MNKGGYLLSNREFLEESWRRMQFEQVEIIPVRIHGKSGEEEESNGVC